MILKSLLRIWNHKQYTNDPVKLLILGGKKVENVFLFQSVIKQWHMLNFFSCALPSKSMGRLYWHLTWMLIIFCVYIFKNNFTSCKGHCALYHRCKYSSGMLDDPTYVKSFLKYSRILRDKRCYMNLFIYLFICILKQQNCVSPIKHVHLDVCRLRFCCFECLITLSHSGRHT